MAQKAFDLYTPAQRTTSVVFASPHSGRAYDQAFLDQAILNEHHIRSSEDAFVDQLFSSVPRTGAPFLVAHAPRAFVDLNRAPEELDPALISGVRRLSHNPRVASGLGVIPRVVSNGRAIYRGKLPIAEAHHRLATFWHPYHDRLHQLMDESCAAFGKAILIDCHSMPHEALDGLAGPQATRPDIVLGDRFGAAAAPRIVDQVEAAFTNVGLKVARNTPFAGAYITQHYGRPTRRHHAVQIEIDRALYLDEKKLEPSANFDAFRAVLAGVIESIAAIGRDDAIGVAAE